MRLLFSIIGGIVVVISMLIVALLIVGPLVRKYFGEPFDFNSDYESFSAMRQAFAVQSFSLGLGFLLFGMATKAWKNDRILLWSILAANPITIMIGYLIYFFNSSLFDYTVTGYYNLEVGGILFLISPIIFTPCAYLGACISARKQIPMGYHCCPK
jgi:hypothetical protein